MLLHDRDGTPRCKVENPEKDLLMQTEKFRLYRTDKGLLRMATSVYNNGVINAEAEIMQYISEKAAEFDRISEEQYDGKKVHYDWLVPKIDATFVSDESQGSRQVNLLSFPDVEVSGLCPMPKLVDYCSIDCKTAAWIMGRFLKLLSFTERIGVNHELHPVHTLIAPSIHRVIYLGLVLGASGPEPLNEKLQITNIKVTAKNILDWIEEDQKETEPVFINKMTSFMEDGRDNANQAHCEFYDLIDGIWGVAYHPFTYYVKSEGIWKHDNTPIV